MDSLDDSYSRTGVSTQGGVVHSHGAEPQSAGEVTGWSRSMALSAAPTHYLPRIPPPFVPRCVVATSPLPTASFVAHLPVWPNNRQVLATTEHRLLAVDATVVSAPHLWVPTQRSREHGWGGLAKSSPQEGANIPELVGPRRRARLVVLGSRLEVACPLKLHPS